MTKAGHTQARKALVEGAWAYRYPAKSSRHLPLRLEKQPKRIQDIRWKAQVRRCKRYRHLVARGKHATVVTVAMARELVGFMGAMAQQVPVTASVQRTIATAPSTQKVSDAHRKRRSPGVVSPSAA
jgi:transposase